MFYQLPPVGNRLSTSKNTDLKAELFFPSQKLQFYESGTAALAASLCAAKGIKKCDKPEVILSAYACPDLVSASLFAGLKPVLVDIEKERPWLDVEQVELSITDNTVAIIAVNLFGIPERWKQLKVLTKKHNVILIEDSAQYFPGGDEDIEWNGDFVILSFGRGKPVSLLGGGAVLCREEGLHQALPCRDVLDVGFKKRLSFLIKAKLYNLMISPYLYWLVKLLPFLHLGETRFHELLSIGAIDRQRLELLAANIRRYQGYKGVDICRKNMTKVLAPLQTVINLPAICNVRNNRRLLRYPLLLDSVSRNKVNIRLEEAGLGASIMYPASLPNIVGMAIFFEGKKKFPNAEELASRLLTLSIKSCASDENVRKINDILKELL